MKEEEFDYRLPEGFSVYKEARVNAPLLVPPETQTLSNASSESVDAADDLNEMLRVEFSFSGNRARRSSASLNLSPFVV